MEVVAGSRKRSRSRTPAPKNTRRKTSAQGSTSNASFYPFWNASSLELSANLWSSIETRCVDSRLIFSNGSFERLAHKSWFSAKIFKAVPTEVRSLPMTCWPSPPSSLPEPMEDVQPSIVESEDVCDEKKTKKKKAPARRERSALLDLDNKQRATLGKWFGTYRWTYKQCVATWKAGGDVSLGALRKRFVNKKSQFLANYKWIFQTPYDLRYEAVREFHVAYDTCMKKRKKDPTFTFEMKYRSKKAPAESMALLSKWYEAGHIYGGFWKCTPLRSRNHDLPAKLTHDSRLLRKRNRFFISVALPLARRSGVPKTGRGKENRASWLDIQEPAHVPLLPPPRQRIVAIDPGVRTFATLYDPSGLLVEWAPKGIRRIYSLCLHTDRLQSRIAAKDLRCRKRQRMRKALQRMRDRVRHLVMEMHRKLAKFLCENYNVVLHPRYVTYFQQSFSAN